MPRVNRASGAVIRDIGEALDGDLPATTRPPTAKEQAAVIDRAPALVLACQLEHNAHFWWCVRELRPLSENDRKRTARSMARPYARKHQLGLRAFERLLLEIASESTDRRARGRLITMASAVAYFPDAPLEAGDAERPLRTDRVELIQRGAPLIVLRGAGACGKCGRGLDARPKNPHTGRPFWRDYCSPCAETAEQWRDEKAVKAVLDELGAAILGEPSRARTRRARTVSGHDRDTLLTAQAEN